MKRLPMQPRKIINDPHEQWEQQLAGAISPPTNALRDWISPEGFTLVDGFRLLWEQTSFERGKSWPVQVAIVNATAKVLYENLYYPSAETAVNTVFMIGREALGDQWLLGDTLPHPDAGHYWGEAE